MSLLVLVIAVLAGAALVSLADRAAPVDALLCAGAPVGIALLGLVGYILASLFGLTPLSVGLSVAVLAPCLLIWSRPGAAPRLPARRRVWRLLFWAAAGVALWAVFDRVFIERADGGIATGDDHNLGDLPFHLAIITGFAHGSNVPPEHPELAGVPLTYPFLVDFVAAQLVTAGASLRRALLFENLALGLGLVGLLYRLGLRTTRSTRAALLTVLLALLNGGFGFWRFFSQGGSPLARLALLGRDYTMSWDGALRWGNALLVLFIPQRSFLIGAPLALLIWILWWGGVVEAAGEAAQRRRMCAAGVVAGLMPLAHMHSFAVVLGLGACLALLFPRPKVWGLFFGIALLVALPQLAWLGRGSAVHGGSFLAWQTGWDRGGRNPILFWLDNTGLFLPLLALAYAWARRRRLARFAAPFLLLFLVPNLLRLSPWMWDNIKFLYFWYLGSVPLVAALLARLARRSWSGAALAAGLTLVLTLSGALDLWRIASRQIENGIFDGAGVRLAALLVQQTPPRALILHAFRYDSPVYLSGRRTLLGYTGHIPSQGLEIGDRETVVRRIYEGPPDSEAMLRRYGVDYVLVGPGERADLRVNEAWLQRLRQVAAVGPYVLYQP
jgi:hypothetical protein